MNVHSLAEPMQLSLSRPLGPTFASDSRVQDILQRIRSVFAEKGFDGASMQDLARAAGMSVGNFYRYFPSKQAIIEAIIGMDMAAFGAEFAEVMRAPDPMAALRAGVKVHLLAKKSLPHDCQIMAEVMALAHRRPEIRAILSAMEDQVIDHLTAVFACATGRSLSEARHEFAAESAYLIAMFRVSLVSATPGCQTSGLVDLILASIDRTLDGIASRRIT